MSITDKLKELQSLVYAGINISENVDYVEQQLASGNLAEKERESAKVTLAQFQESLLIQAASIDAISRAIAPPSEKLDSIVRLLGPDLEDCPEMRRVLKRDLATITDRYAVSRRHLLSERERDLLSTGMAQTRHSWDSTWIGEVVSYGYTGTELLTDLEIIRDALCDNLCISNVNDEDLVEILAILQRDDVLDIVIDRLHNHCDEDGMKSFTSDLLRATDTLEDPASYYTRVEALCENILDRVDAAEVARANDELTSTAPSAVS